jgi:hypothetical protein
MDPDDKYTLWMVGIAIGGMVVVPVICLTVIALFGESGC